MKKLCPTCNRPLGEKTASAMGKKGGSQSSEAKTIAAKKNIEKRWADHKKNSL